MSTLITTPYDRERSDIAQTKGFTITLSPWTVQNICLELVANYFLNNDPEKLGYAFKQKYSNDKLKSEIFLDIAYNWNAQVIGQRPAIFVQRDSCRLASPIMNQVIGSAVAESEQSRMHMNYLNVGLACIATNLGFCEQLADYVKQPFAYFQQQIREDYRFRRFRLLDIAAPRLYTEAKDHFIIMLTVETVFDENWVIKGDDLKIKSMSKMIFDSITGNRIPNQ